MAAPATGRIPYVAKVVRDYLFPVLLDDDRVPKPLRVSTYVPASRPLTLVTISTVPTNDPGNIALSPRRCIIHIWHADELTAGNVSEAVFGYLKDAKYVPGKIRNVSVVGTPARLDDPDDDTPRFQITVDVLLRAGFH